MTIKNQLENEIKNLIIAMQHLEEECHKSTFAPSVFSLDLKILKEYISNIESKLNEMIEKEQEKQTSDRLQVLKEVMVVFERKVDFFIANVPLNKNDASVECKLLQDSFQVFTELYDSFK